MNGISYHATENTLIFIPPLAFHRNVNVRETDIALIQFSSNFLKENSTEMKDSLILNCPQGSSPLFFLDKDGTAYETMRRIIDFCQSGQSDTKTSSENLLSRQFQMNGLLLELLSSLMNEHRLN